VSEQVPDAADGAEHAPSRRAPDDGPPPRPALTTEPPQTSPADEPGAANGASAADVTAAADDPTPRAAGVAREAGKRSESGHPDARRKRRADRSKPPIARERPGGSWPMPDRSLIATVLGVHPAVAVGVAAVLTAVGVTADLLRMGTLGIAFTVCYLTGCVLATAWVRRSGLFWPMVAPPLLMAIAVPVVVLVASTPRPEAGVAGRLLVIAAPLVNGFPIMAWTTGLVLALGVFRLAVQRINAPPRGRAAARAEGRRSTSPRRS
jgi:uncharacterized protein DUF6542